MRHLVRYAALAAGLGACSSDVPTRAVGPAIRIAGDEVMARALLPHLAETYQRNVPDVRIEIEGGGPTHAFRELVDGAIDLVASSRTHTPAELEQAAAQNIDLAAPGARAIVGVNVIGVKVHPSNPLGSLTYDQIIGMFCTGSISSWSHLGLADQPIHAVAPPTDDGTRVLFEDFFCGPPGMRSARTLDAEALRTALHEDVGAIGFTSLADEAGKTLKLRPDSAADAIAPTMQHAIRGIYPLAHDLYLYAPGTPSPDARAFLDWIASPAGQEVVDEARFVPLYLRPERLDGPRPMRETIQFEEGSDTPTQRSQARLQLLVNELRSRSGEFNHVILEGYTDSRERNAVELARRRALAVERMLRVELPGLFYEIIPRGADTPIAPNNTPLGRIRNRRVQIYLAEEEEGGFTAVTAP